MIPTRESGASQANRRLRQVAARKAEGNAAWFARQKTQAGIILLGGTSLVDFRVRVAQSLLRNDLSPSYWSMAGIVLDDGSIRTVSLEFDSVADVPRANGVRLMSVQDFDDAGAWPNIAILTFAQDAEFLAAHADVVAQRRTIVDVPQLLVRWLAYVWAVERAANPLLDGSGVPSAAFVEAASSLAGIELTPGLSSSASCPEAIWQAVKWWYEYYVGVVELGTAGAAGTAVPTGSYVVRQKSAALDLGEN